MNKKNFVIALITGLAAAFTAHGTEKVNIPQFAKYAVDNAYVGKPVNVDLATEDEKMYRTRLRDAAKGPANFAGEYALTTWGCGTSCITGAVVSLKTGKVSWLPGSVCCWKGEGERLEFRLNSRLLVTAGIMNEEGVHGAHFYEFTGGNFKHLLTVPVKEEEAD